MTSEDKIILDHLISWAIQSVALARNLSRPCDRKAAEADVRVATEAVGFILGDVMRRKLDVEQTARFFTQRVIDLMWDNAKDGPRAFTKADIMCRCGLDGYKGRDRRGLHHSEDCPMREWRFV